MSSNALQDSLAGRFIPGNPVMDANGSLAAELTHDFNTTGLGSASAWQLLWRGVYADLQNGIDFFVGGTPTDEDTYNQMRAAQNAAAKGGDNTAQLAAVRNQSIADETAKGILPDLSQIKLPSVDDLLGLSGENLPDVANVVLWGAALLVVLVIASLVSD